jgi:hypothetical protein
MMEAKEAKVDVVHIKGTDIAGLYAAKGFSSDGDDKTIFIFLLADLLFRHFDELNSCCCLFTNQKEKVSYI